MIDNGKIAWWLAITMHAHALVDRGEVVEHFVRLFHLVFQVAEQPMYLLLLYPNSGDTIAGLLEDSRRPDLCSDFLYDVRCGDHTSSGSRSTVACCRVGRSNSRIEGSGGRVVSCWPTTQLSGRRSTCTSFCNRRRPSTKASGRGGQPGT